MIYPDVPLCEISSPISRVVPVTPGTSYRTIGVKWWGEGAYERETIDGSETAARVLSFVREGDLIINKIWVRHGSTAIATKAVDGCAASNEFPTFELDLSKVLHRWIHWQTKTRSFWEKCDQLSRGTSGKNRIKPELFLTIKIPLPPVSEQRRILSRIEELAAKVEEARGLRRLAAEEANSFRESTAAKLLREQPDAVVLPIEMLAEVRGGIQKGPHRVAGANPIRYLTVAHVHRNRIVLDDPRYFEVNAGELERWALIAGDVLIIEGNGSESEIGRAALFRGELQPCVHQNHVIRVRLDQARIWPEYLNLYLNSPVGKDAVQQQSRTTSGLRSLSVGRIRQIPILVPTLQEQHRIVAYLDGLQAKVDALKKLQAETAAELDALLPSILDKAFNGEL